MKDKKWLSPRETQIQLEYVGRILTEEPGEPVGAAAAEARTRGPRRMSDKAVMTAESRRARRRG